MTLTITIANDTDGARLLKDFCAATGYDAASGKTQGEWVKETIIKQLREISKRGEMKTAAATINSQIDAIAIT